MGQAAEVIVEELVLALVGLSAGAAVAGGLFSFIVELGVIADFADRTHTGDKLLFYETCVALGGIIGNIVFPFFTLLRRMRYRLLLRLLRPGRYKFCLGFLPGLFVGCWSMALAEILNGFSDLYAPRANRQIRVCFCDRRSHRKRIGSRIVFLKRLVEDERQGGISTGKLS